MKVIQIKEAELDRLRDELLTRLERDSLKGGSDNLGKPLSYHSVHFHLHRFVEAIKDA
jgi:hypothetical protein